MRKVKDEFTSYVYSEVVAPIKKANFSVGDSTINADDLPEETDEGYIGKIEGKVDFYDGSWLKFKELIEFNYNKPLDCLDMDRPYYKYNYHGPNNKIRIAYHCRPRENRYKNLDSFPHHKHIGPKENDFTEGNKDVKITDILKEIEDVLE